MSFSAKKKVWIKISTEENDRIIFESLCFKFITNKLKIIQWYPYKFNNRIPLN